MPTTPLNQRPTPETDKASQYIVTEGGVARIPEGDLVEKDFARSLEQRLSAMSEAAKSLASAAGHIGYVSSGDPHVIKKAEKAIELFEQVLSEIEAHK